MAWALGVKGFAVHRSTYLGVRWTADIRPDRKETTVAVRKKRPCHLAVSPFQSAWMAAAYRESVAAAVAEAVRVRACRG